MNQISFGIRECELYSKRTRKREFLDQISLMVPWAKLVGLMIEPHAPASKTGRPLFAMDTLLRNFQKESVTGIWVSAA